MHSFWIPQLGGKRDLITNHTNYLWFTPDSSLARRRSTEAATSTAARRTRTCASARSSVTPAEFDGLGAASAPPAAFAAPQPPAPPPTLSRHAVTRRARHATGARRRLPRRPRGGARSRRPQPAGYTFPMAVAADHATPRYADARGTHVPGRLTGDAQRGAQQFSRSACIGCHADSRKPRGDAPIGPNLTHIGSRSTIGAGHFRTTPAPRALDQERAHDEARNPHADTRQGPVRPDH